MVKVRCQNNPQCQNRWTCQTTGTSICGFCRYNILILLWNDYEIIDISHLTDKVQTVSFCDFLLSSEPPSELKNRGVGVWLTSVLEVPLSHKLNSQLLFDISKNRMSHTEENSKENHVQLVT